MTATATTTGISISDIMAKAEATVELVDKMLPEIEFGSSLIPTVGPELVAVEQAAHLFAPTVEDVLLFMMQETGKPLNQVVADLANHITFGPNSSILAPVPGVVPITVSDIPVDRPGV
jgi:hypothetical protein